MAESSLEAQRAAAALPAGSAEKQALQDYAVVYDYLSRLLVDDEATQGLDPTQPVRYPVELEQRQALLINTLIQELYAQLGAVDTAAATAHIAGQQITRDGTLKTTPQTQTQTGETIPGGERPDTQAFNGSEHNGSVREGATTLDARPSGPPRINPLHVPADMINQLIVGYR